MTCKELKEFLNTHPEADEWLVVFEILDTGDYPRGRRYEDVNLATLAIQPYPALPSSSISLVILSQ